MKIEQISENQIKCTLNRSDLASRQIKISELAYGSEKTRGLFQDMMEQAFTQFGFDASDIPLMIEAIPVSVDCIVLMITKVEDPDEMEPGFANFRELSDLYDDALPPFDMPLGEEGDLSQDGSALQDHPTSRAAGSKRSSLADPNAPLERLFSFDSLETVIQFAYSAGSYQGESSLYKSPDNGRYYLVLTKAADSLNEFARICNTALEYGSKEPMGFARSAFMDEHFDKIIASRALQKLADV